MSKIATTEVILSKETKRMLKQFAAPRQSDPIKQFSSVRHATLTPREVEIGRMLLARGLEQRTEATDHAIAADLGIRPGTVFQHRKSIYRRLGVSRRKDCLEALEGYLRALDEGE